MQGTGVRKRFGANHFQELELAPLGMKIRVLHRQSFGLRRRIELLVGRNEIEIGRRRGIWSREQGTGKLNGIGGAQAAGADQVRRLRNYRLAEFHDVENFADVTIQRGQCGIDFLRSLDGFSPAANNRRRNFEMSQSRNNQSIGRSCQLQHPSGSHLLSIPFD